MPYKHLKYNISPSTYHDAMATLAVHRRFQDVQLPAVKHMGIRMETALVAGRSVGI